MKRLLVRTVEIVNVVGCIAIKWENRVAMAYFVFTKWVESTFDLISMKRPWHANRDQRLLLIKLSDKS